MGVTIPQISTTYQLPAADDYIEQGGTTRGSGKNLLTNFPQQVTTINALTALTLTNVANNAAVFAQGRLSVSDMGGGLFRYSSSGTDTVDYGTVWSTAAGSGRWLRDNVKIIDVTDFGAGTGSLDDTGAITSAINACLPDGTVSEILINQTLSGFGTPQNDWTQRPSITLTGALNGASGFAASGNINARGFLCSIEITNKGSGYYTLPILVSKTNGSPIITKADGSAFDSRIIAGVSIRHDSLAVSCTVISRSGDGKALTMSQNADYTNSDYFVFGMPVVNYTPFGGSVTPDYYNLVPVLGSNVALIFPPRTYYLPNGLPSFNGLSNLTIIAKGANFNITSNTGAIGVWFRSSTSIRWYGGEFKFTGARYQTPYVNDAGTIYSARYGGQNGFSISCCQYFYLDDVRLYDSFEFGFAVGGASSTAYPSTRVYLRNVETINSLGDGIHVTTGANHVRVNNAKIQMPGDDCLAVVDDLTGYDNKPYDVIFEDCYISGGNYRGCVAIGALNVVFRNIYGRGTHGPFLWAAADGAVPAPTNVAFLSILGEDLGNASMTYPDANSGAGLYAANMTGLTIRDVVLKPNSTYYYATTFNTSNITNLDWDQEYLESSGSNTTYTGSRGADVNLSPGNNFAYVTLTPGRWFVTGVIPLRFSAVGTTNLIWPVLYDGTTEYGNGTPYQSTDQATRQPCTCSAVINVNNSTKNIYFKIKNGDTNASTGNTIDAGSYSSGTPSGINSYIVAHRLP